MTVDAALAALEATAVATRIRESLYLFPFLESTHVVGLATVFGGATILDLRLLGIAGTRRPAHRIAADVLPWTLAGFLVAAATGLLMFTTNAGVYYHNTFFRVKMALLLLCGLNMLVFEVTARRSVHSWDGDRAAPAAGRAVAALSLGLWIGVIVLGRWVGFAISSTPPPVDPSIDLERLEDFLPK